jgi:hypothetical protein
MMFDTSAASGHDLATHPPQRRQCLLRLSRESEPEHPMDDKDLSTNGSVHALRILRYEGLLTGVLS